ncbi:unnamed protein product [Polarella glacialis]|uniref:Uncharacterized protein n=1 Tax=Polarella glacialis TaxID=89957 RepID=A0A813ECW0_POLGL|nr:unnamed protein product [Polarella glacialis]CAE8637666.1 unnamed protein product [Polarella glacialis]
MLERAQADPENLEVLEVKADMTMVEKLWSDPRLRTLDPCSLMRATSRPDLSMCRRLLSDSRFTAFNVKSAEGYTAMGMAAYGMVGEVGDKNDDESIESRFQITRMLFEDARAEVHGIGRYNVHWPAPLHVVAKARMVGADAKFVDMARTWLCDARTDVNATSSSGETLLHFVCGYGAELHTGIVVANLERCQMILANPAFRSMPSS